MEYLKNKIDKNESIDNELINTFLYLNKIKKVIKDRQNNYSLVSNNKILYTDKEKLNKNLVSDLIVTVIIGSPTTIENYLTCPYKYFAEKTLGLKAREIYKIENYDIGNVIHYISNGK